MAAPTSDTYSAAPGTTIYAGRAAPGPGALVATVTLANTSASEQITGFITPMFGHAFRQGDIPAGEFPVFKTESGAGCPATIWGVTSWPDGSMKFCAAMVRVASAVPGSGSIALEIWSGGSAPSASARSTADLTAADLKVELTGVANLTGTWTASLNDGITDASDLAVVGDGPAGKVWRIGSELRNGGAAHGQLYCWHYVAALQDASGALAGLRYMGRIAQPWSEISSPAAAARTVTAVLKSGASTIRTLQGTDEAESATTNIVMAHFSGFATAGADAKYDYIQGGGSMPADCTVYVRHTPADLIKSRLVPPYNTAVTPTIPAAPNYRPYCQGSMVRYTGATGEREDIAVLAAWCSRHALNPTEAALKSVRVNALATTGWRTGARLRSTRNVIIGSDMGKSYTGLGAAQPDWRFPSSGFNTPSPNTSLWYQEEESHHRPSNTYYAYLVTGEPQYLDLLLEQAANFIMWMPAGTITFKTAHPVNGALATTEAYGQRTVALQGGSTYPAGGAFFIPYGSRLAAWLSRDVSQAAAIAPNSMPDGSAVREYLRDVANNFFDAINAYTAAMPQSYRDAGIHAFDGIEGYSSPWMNGYLSNSVCHQASILGTENAAQFRAHLAKWYSSVGAVSDMAGFGSYRWMNTMDNGDRVYALEQIVFGVGLLINSMSLSFSTSTSRFTPGGTQGSWTPTDGDVFAFSGGTKPFSAAVDRKRFFAVNCSGNTFQLAETPGGSPITVTTDGTINSFFMRLASFAPHHAYDSYDSNDGYTANAAAAIRHHEACGDSSIAAARAKADALVTAAAITFTSDPKNALAPTYPA